ncbi:MAG: twin-arginine translocase subunit TatC [Alphaproteobacteria bacterium]
MNAPTREDEELMEKSKAPLLDHLIELRVRIIRSLVAFFVAFVICYVFARDIYAFLVQPLADALAGQPDRHLIFTALYETFFTYVKLGMFGALCLAFPYIAAQLWLFIAPGLYRDERRAFLPFLFASPVMFLVGAAFVYYIIMPLAIRFFLGFESPGGEGQLPIELQAKVSEYLSFAMTLIVGFGLCFQLPVLLTLLGRVGMVSSAQLVSMRRYAIVGVFAVAAFITPPDAFSMLSLAIPLVLLYEVSIFCVRLIEKKRAAQPAEA